ncbi:hypothetical protein BDV33DRAFT_170165 [Aspergillus novoparasiticus]|uniref:Uncharacterized protein n=1 Tax=Aspergillus novoparasiticus TaxID=986946 RepID=A0A5N6EW10_9EURO|nr:hypothetical protein BDV33DRAFT_170165 [Aspergillus novoparasiticus]
MRPKPQALFNLSCSICPVGNTIATAFRDLTRVLMPLTEKLGLTSKGQRWGLDSLLPWQHSLVFLTLLSFSIDLGNVLVTPLCILTLHVFHGRQVLYHLMWEFSPFKATRNNLC